VESRSSVAISHNTTDGDDDSTGSNTTDSNNTNTRTWPENGAGGRYLSLQAVDPVAELDFKSVTTYFTDM
jgi:hypothetical protein